VKLFLARKLDEELWIPSRKLLPQHHWRLMSWSRQRWMGMKVMRDSSLMRTRSGRRRRLEEEA
jgi:hypothetical protein